MALYKVFTGTDSYSLANTKFLLYYLSYEFRKMTLNTRFWSVQRFEPMLAASVGLQFFYYVASVQQNLGNK